MKIGRATWIRAAALLAGLAAFSGLGLMARRAGKEPEAEPERPAPVLVRAVEARDIARRVEAIGRIEPRADILIAAEQPGVVAETPADKGRLVRRGELLLRLDDRLARIAVEEASLRAMETGRDLERGRGLLARGAMALGEVQSLETRDALARANLARAETLLDKRSVRSPADGWIEERFLEPGDYAREGDGAFRLLDTATVRIVFDIPERDIGRVRPGQRLAFRVDALEGESFAGELSFLAGKAARENHSFAAELTAGNPDGRLRAGMLARVELDLGTLPGAVAVPVHAVIPQRGLHVVFVATDDGRAERRVVRIAEFSDREAILSSGLGPGDRLIVEGHRTLSDGQPVLPLSDPKDAGEDAAP